MGRGGDPPISAKVLFWQNVFFAEGVGWGRGGNPSAEKIRSVVFDSVPYDICLNLLYQVMSVMICHIKLQYVMICHVNSWYIMICEVLICPDMSYQVLICHDKLCCN